MAVEVVLGGVSGGRGVEGVGVVQESVAMVVALTSDWHGMLPDEIPECDAMIVAGDICPDFIDPMQQPRWLMNEFPDWVREHIPITIPIYATWGNHDWTQELTRETEEYWPTNIKMIVDDWHPINGRKVWFSPWCQNLPRWAWNLSDEAATKAYARIPPDIDIIVSHAPPFGAGDSLHWSATKYGLPKGTRVGSKELAARIKELSQLRMVICGHIHEDRGVHLGDVEVFNVASVDGGYTPHDNRFVVVEW
jgi:Icc-related predicted phosphoesterase